MRLMSVTHFRRGGGHAFISWIIGHYSVVDFHNNVRRVQNHAKAEVFLLDKNMDPTEGRPELELWSYEDEVVPSDAYLLRSFYNIYASRLRSRREMPSRIPTFPLDIRDRWVKMASLDDVILFEEFCVSPALRAMIRSRLKLPGFNDTILRTTNPGIRSAFGDKDAVMNRYEQEPLPDSVLQDDELRELHLSKFGWALNSRGERII